MIQGKRSKSKVGQLGGGSNLTHCIEGYQFIDSNSISYQSLLDIYIIYILTINVWKLLSFPFFSYNLRLRWSSFEVGEIWGDDCHFRLVLASCLFYRATKCVILSHAKRPKKNNIQSL